MPAFAPSPPRKGRADASPRAERPEPASAAGLPVPLLLRTAGPGVVQRKCACGGSSGESCPTCEEEERLAVQRQPLPAAPPAGDDGSSAPEPAPYGVLVDDGTPAAEGRTTVSAFMDALESRLRPVCDEELSAAGRSTEGCPYLDAWLAHYRAQPALRVERAIRRYTGAEAGDATALVEAVVSRARRAAASWALTGRVPEMPGGVPPDGLPGSSGGAVQAKAAHGGGSARASAAEPAAVRARLGSGRVLDPGVRSRMEAGLGVSLARVRVHTDARAAGLASDLGARAFAVGSDVAFGAGEYRPGTPLGDLLIAHELAHTVQQASGGLSPSAAESPELEREADEAAAGALGRGTAGAWLRRRAGLSLQRCGKSRAELDAARVQIADGLRDPDANADAILRTLDGLSGSDAREVLGRVGGLREPSRLDFYAQFEGGRRVLERIAAVFEDGNAIERSRARPIRTVLARYAAPGRAPTADQRSVLDRINAAVAAEPEAERRAYAEPPPLRFPVELYTPGRETMGGVYYDPSLPSDRRAGGAAGVTTGAHLPAPAGRPAAERFHGGYIRIGPLAITSDANIRSTLRHEHMHYRLHLSYNRPLTDPDLAALRDAVRTGAASARPDTEIEVTSSQIVADFAALPDADLRSVLEYLATNMADAAATQQFRDRGVRRIVDSVRADAAKQARLLRLIAGLEAAERRALEPLRAAVAALAPPSRRRAPRQRTP